LQDKPLRIYILKEIWDDVKYTVSNGIEKKLSAAKQNIKRMTKILLLEYPFMHYKNSENY